jgi:hypothetical protein
MSATGAFLVGAVLCAMGAVFTIVLLPGPRREAADEDVQLVALSFTRCPGASYCGHLARAVAFGRRLRIRVARS